MFLKDLSVTIPVADEEPVFRQTERPSDWKKRKKGETHTKYIRITSKFLCFFISFGQ